MSTKITELPAASSVASTDVVPIVAQSDGATKKATVDQIRGGVRGRCYPETFEAVGDGTTSDQTPISNALTAIGSGTYAELKIGATTHLVTGLAVPTGAIIEGTGPKSVLLTATDAPILSIANPSAKVEIRKLTLRGNSTGTSQHGLVYGAGGAGSGPLEGRFHGITAELLGGSGFVAQNGLPGGVHAGPSYFDCDATTCGTGFNFANSGEFCSVHGGTIRSCPIGIQMQAANTTLDGVTIVENGTGLKFLPGTNDGHCPITNCKINHNTTAIDCGAVTGQPITLLGCHLYQGAIVANGNTAVLALIGCEVDPSSITVTNGKLRLVNCTLMDDYVATVTETGTGWIEVVNCVGRDGGTLPTWASSRVQRNLTFTADADQNQTWPESVAKTIFLTTGSLASSGKTVRSQWGANAKREQRFVNNTPYTINVGWSGGTTYSLASGAWVLLGSDGTNAVALESFALPSASNGQILCYQSGAWTAGNLANYMGLGAGTLATAGLIRTQQAVAEPFWQAGAYVGFDTSASNELFVGGNKSYANQFPTHRFYAGSAMLFGIGSTTYAQYTGGEIQLVPTTLKIGADISGYNGNGVRFKKASYTVSGTVTLSAAQAECPIQQITGGTGGTVVAPNTSNTTYYIDDLAGPAINFQRSGGVSVAFSAGGSGVVYHNSTDYVRLAS